MIPKSDLYANTDVNPLKTMMQVNTLLEKFDIKEKRLTQQGPENSFFEFIIRKENDVALLIKIKIPFIETTRNKNGRKTEYDEARSFRYFYHYLKALLSAKEAELVSIEEVFMAHIVMKLPDGQAVTLGEQLVKQIETGNTPMLSGFDIVANNKIPKLEKIEV